MGEDRRERRRDALAVAALLLLHLAVHRGAVEQGFYSDDFVFLLHARDFTWAWFSEHLLGFGAEGQDWVYWRPGVYLTTRLLYLLFGLDPAPWMVTAVVLHLAVVLAAYALARSAAAPVPAAVLGAAFLVVSPAAQETVSWMCTSVGVLPATLCAIASVWCLVRHVESGSLGWYALGLASAALSLAFKELAYHLVPFAFAVGLAHARTLRPRALLHAALRAAPFLALAAFHYEALNRVTADTGAGAGLTARLLDLEAHYLRSALGLPLGDAWLLVLAVLGFGAALAVREPRARVLAVWAAVATAPYVAKAYADRHAYVLLVALAAALPAVLSGALRGRLLQRVAGFTALGALVVQAAWRLPEAQERQRAAGRLCADVLAWALEERLEDFDHLCPDFVPPALENGFGPMIGLHTGGDGPGVLPNSTLVFPPFQVLLLGDLPPEGEGVAFLRFDHATSTYRRVPRAAMFEGTVTVPVLCLVGDYEVAGSAEEALARAASGRVDLRRRVVLHASPAAEVEPGPSRIVAYGGWPEVLVELDVSSPSLLVISVPAPLVEPRGGLEVTIDGRAVEPLPANGFFHAVPVPAGAREARIVVPL